MFCNSTKVVCYAKDFVLRDDVWNALHLHDCNRIVGDRCSHNVAIEVYSVPFFCFLQGDSTKYDVVTIEGKG